MAEPGPSGEQEPTVGRLVRSNLLFLLGLVPVLVAMLRVGLAAQGDYGAVMTLVRTLDVPALIVGTFVRGIGLLLAAASGYVIVRVYWLGSGKAARPELSRSLLPVLWVIFAIGVLATYLEELVDTDKLTGWKSVWPVDLLRSEGWFLAVFVVLPWLWRRRRVVPGVLREFRGAWRRSKADPGPAASAPNASASSSPETKGYLRDRWPELVIWGLAVCVVLACAVPSAPRKLPSVWRRSKLRTRWPELFIIGPVVLSLFWNNVATNERMWLPSEVITVTASSSLRQSVLRADPDFPAKDDDHPVIRWIRRKGDKGDTLIIVAYVLASDGQSLTVTTPAGGIYLLPDDSTMTRQACQDLTEPRPDQVPDEPLLLRLPGQHPQPSTDQTPICKDLILQASAHQAT
jgi:hypothetical protein